MKVSERPIKLKNVSLFQGLKSTDLQKIEKRLVEKSFGKGQTLMSEGEECARILIVRTGRVKVYRLSSGGKEQILEVLGPGDSCACNPGASQWHCSASAEAETPCHVWFLPRENYVKLVNSNSNLAHSLNKIFAERLCRFCSLVESVSLNEPKKRLVKFILDMTKNNGGEAPQLSLTHEDIANRLGLVRETVTRHLQQLKKKNLIQTKDRRILIIDKKGLEKLLSY